MRVQAPNGSQAHESVRHPAGRRKMAASAAAAVHGDSRRPQVLDRAAPAPSGARHVQAWQADIKSLHVMMGWNRQLT